MRGKNAPGGSDHLLEDAQTNALPESSQVIGNIVLLAPELLYVSHPVSSSASIYTVGAVNSRLSIRSRTPP
jgi:phospholipase C